MPIAKIACPCCKAGLKSDLPETGAKKVKCPKCGAGFQAVMPPNGKEQAAAISASPMMGRLVAAAPSNSQVLVGRPFQPPPARSFSPLLWLALLIPGALVF